MVVVKVGSGLMTRKESKLSFMKRMADMVVKILLQMDDCESMMAILMNWAV